MSTSQQPLNVRNNNPGNLRFANQPEATPGEGGFARFETPQAGMAAMQRQIELDTQQRGLNLTDFLNKYAPPSENNTNLYIDFVTKKTGLDPKAVVPVSAIPQLQLAMIEMEGGPRSLSHFSNTQPSSAKAQAPRTTAQGPKQVGARIASAFNPRDLPSSYTSALALNYLADTDPEGVTMGKVNEMLANMMEDGGGGSTKSPGGKILQEFASAKSIDPYQFVLQQEAETAKPKQAVPRMPRAFADGGEVDMEQKQWEEEIPVRALSRKLNETVDKYRQGLASEADIKQFFPNYSDYDIANMFGMTDAGQNGPRPEIIGQPFLTPQIYERAMNRSRMEEQNIKDDIRNRDPSIYPHKREFSLQLQQLADGGEVDAEQMTVGTLLPREEPAFVPTAAPMIRPGVSVPTMDEVPRVDAQGRIIRETPTPDQVYTPLQKAVGGAEVLGTVLSGVTAPASIVYDLARGVPQGQVSPSNFMYQPIGGAGQEYAQGLGRLAQDLKLDVAMPQVQLQRPYPVGAMARQGVDVVKAPIDRAKIRAAAAKVPEDVTYDPLRERLQSQGILSLATRPKGSAIDSSEDVISVGLAIDDSKKDRLKGLTSGTDAYIAEENRLEANKNLIYSSFVPKLENYINRQFGTADDPLYESTVSGKFLPQSFYRPNSIFRFEEQIVADITGIKLKNNVLTLEHVNKLQELAKQGDKRAIDMLGRAYDLSGATRAVVSGSSIPPGNAPNLLQQLNSAIQRDVGAKNTTINLVDPRLYHPSDRIKNPKLLEEMKRGKPVFEMHGPSIFGGIINYDDVVDYTLKNDPNKWTKMSIPELVLASNQNISKVIDPVKIAKYAYEGKELVPFQKRLGTETYLPIKDSPALGKGAEWREIKTKEALLTEGGRSMLNHCLKSNKEYCNTLEKGEAKYFSLRDADGHPHATILIAKNDSLPGKPFNRVTQIKGFENSNTMPMYGKEVSDFLTHYEEALNKSRQGTRLVFSEANEYVPNKFQPGRFGIDNPDEGAPYAKGGMVDKPLYDRAV